MSFTNFRFKFYLAFVMWDQIKLVEAYIGTKADLTAHVKMVWKNEICIQKCLNKKRLNEVIIAKKSST